MLKRYLVLFLSVVLFAVPAFGARKGTKTLLPGVVVTDAGPNVVNVENQDNGAAYIRVRTQSETGVATLTVTIEVYDGLAGTDVQLCSFTPITATGTYWMMVGSTLAAAGDVSDVCDSPLPRDFTVTYTITGTTSPGFTVTSEIHFLADSY